MEGTQAGQREDGAEGAPAPPFLIGGHNPALDLVNTEYVVRRQRRDMLPTVGSLRAWWAAASARYPDDGAFAEALAGAGQWDGGTLAAVKALRAALRRLFAALAAGEVPPAADLATLNAVLATCYPALEQSAEGIEAGYHARDRAAGGPLLPIALSARRLFAEGSPGRIHTCERCAAPFYDTSKRAARRWCGAACMNRARSSAHYAQAKAASTRV